MVFLGEFAIVETKNIVELEGTGNVCGFFSLSRPNRRYGRLRLGALNGNRDGRSEGIDEPAGAGITVLFLFSRVSVHVLLLLLLGITTRETASSQLIHDSSNWASSPVSYSFTFRSSPPKHHHHHPRSIEFLCFIFLFLVPPFPRSK